MDLNLTRDALSGNKIVEFATYSREETVDAACMLGGLLRRGDILCLDGDLGAGKTAFTSGLAKGMDIAGIIASPTFTILMEHTRHETPSDQKMPLYHFDAYRLEDEEDFFNLGFDEYFSFGGVCVIEWAERIRPAIPSTAIWISMKQASVDLTDQRKLQVAFPASDTRAALLYKNLCN